jgi:SPP1 family predicted phage head-tail adaptor
MRRSGFLSGDLFAIRAGDLRDRIVVEIKTETTDSFGATVETWSEAFTTRARYQPLGSSEFPVLQKRGAETTVRFIIRYRPDWVQQQPAVNIAAMYRIVGRGKTWNISEPIDNSERTMLIIEASELK